VPLLLLPEQDRRHRRALDELSRLGVSDLGDGRLVGAEVFERSGQSRVWAALASAEALERDVAAWRDQPETSAAGVEERLADLREEVESLARERLELARDRMVAEANVTGINRALLVAAAIESSLNATANGESDESRVDRARQALEVLNDRRSLLQERLVAAHQAIAAFEILDARLVAADEAVTSAIAAAAVALATARRTGTDR
jgi:hypothetical protein